MTGYKPKKLQWIIDSGWNAETILFNYHIDEWAEEEEFELTIVGVGSITYDSLENAMIAAQCHYNDEYSKGGDEIEWIPFTN